MEPIRPLSVILSAILLAHCAFGEDVCVQRGPCKCVFANGTGIDLSQTSNGTEFYKAPIYSKSNTSFVLKTYFFHPCSNIKPSTDIKPENSTCGEELSLYRETYRMTVLASDPLGYKSDGGLCEKAGAVINTEFSSDGSLIVVNKPANTTIRLVCAQTPTNRLQVVNIEEANDVELAFYSRDACLKQIEEVGRSFGSTLLIIFFSLVIFYLTLGVLTRKFLMGATGLEVIPNLGFWMDLPNLVKDGWAFARNGFKLPNRGVGPTTSPDPNSYDSI